MRLHMVVRRPLSIAVAALAPLTAHAQDVASGRDSVGPRAGAWGAELGIGSGQSATLLRFRSSRSALLLGAEALWMDVAEDTPIPGGGTQENSYTVASVTGRIGFRRYGGATPSLRPFTSAGLLMGYSRDPAGSGWTGGGFGELGASYFFSPHLSVGAVGGLQVVYTQRKRDFGFGESSTGRSLSVRASAVQLLGAVYF